MLYIDPLTLTSYPLLCSSVGEEKYLTFGTHVAYEVTIT